MENINISYYDYCDLFEGQSVDSHTVYMRLKANKRDEQYNMYMSRVDGELYNMKCICGKIICPAPPNSKKRQAHKKTAYHIKALNRLNINPVDDDKLYNITYHVTDTMPENLLHDIRGISEMFLDDNDELVDLE